MFLANEQRPKTTFAPSPDEPRSKPPFELRYTADAAADIKALDGSVQNQLRKVLEKKLAVDPEGYGLPLRGSLAEYWKPFGLTGRGLIFLGLEWLMFVRNL